MSLESDSLVVLHTPRVKPKQVSFIFSTAYSFTSEISGHVTRSDLKPNTVSKGFSFHNQNHAVIRLHNSLEVAVGCLLQSHAHYICSGTNRVETGALIFFWGGKALFFKAGQLRRCPPLLSAREPKHTE